MKYIKSLICLLIWFIANPIHSIWAQDNSHFNLPAIEKETKPWTYWWWPGSAVDKTNLTYNLEQYAEAGIGGVHIIPIYGVKGFEEKFIDYLSPKWMEMLAYTRRECERLGMDMDLTIGTGWPFGGAHVPPQWASAQLNDIMLEIKGESVVNHDFILDAKQKSSHPNPEQRTWTLLAVNAYSQHSQRLDLIGKLDAQGRLTWQAPAGNWKIIALVLEAPVQQVKRAAPGAKGNVVDPFSVAALDDYLSYFDNAFKHYNGKMVRSFYHDSYEYYRADWTRNFLVEFQQRRGYDLLDVLPTFLGNGKKEIIARVKADYRATLAELHTEYVQRIAAWAHEKGASFRNQAHGSPTNILDTYAAADIPECEVFGAPLVDIPGLRREPEFVREEFIDPLILKFASSAAHMAGHQLVASETCTWLADHFRVALSQVKPEIDILFFSGVNHILFHGIAYSPKAEPWPGWQFYAATSFAPTNSIWYDFSALNSYITRCQSVLQAGKPDNELLIYFPIWDIWHHPEGRILGLQVHNPEKWLYSGNFYRLTKRLIKKGYSFDYISDQQIEKSKIINGKIFTESNRYQAMIIPSCRFIPVQTLQKLNQLALAGGTVIFMNQIPDDVPGYFQHEKRINELEALRDEVIRRQHSKKGQTLMSHDLSGTLTQTGIIREELGDFGINFIRRKIENGRYYFIVNQQSKSVNTWVNLAYPAKSVIIFDPVTGKTGLAKVKQKSNGRVAIYLQLESGASLILKAIDTKIDGEKWIYLIPFGDGYEINGEWSVDFLAGGPVIPQNTTIKKLSSWTTFKDIEAQRFAGTARYKTSFVKPNLNTENWILDLGMVRESARIRINQHDIGILWSIPCRIPIGKILNEGENLLEIVVTNLSANRIRDLDRRGVLWKKFYDINFVNIHYQPFDASKWEIVDSGLMGPVKLYPATTPDSLK